MRIIDASYHRNGVSGVGFYAVIFESPDHQPGPMIATLFDEPGYCAAYSIPLLSEGNIKFAKGNSWRGDRIEDELRPLLAEFLEKEGTNRIGPFSI